jgi:hypothetical protein
MAENFSVRQPSKREVTEASLAQTQTAMSPTSILLPDVVRLTCCVDVADRVLGRRTIAVRIGHCRRRAELQSARLP